MWVPSQNVYMGVYINWMYTQVYIECIHGPRVSVDREETRSMNPEALPHVQEEEDSVGTLGKSRRSSHWKTKRYLFPETKLRQLFCCSQFFDQQFSNLSVHHNYLWGFVKHRFLGPGVSDLVDLEFGPRIGIWNKLSGDAPGEYNLRTSVINQRLSNYGPQNIWDRLVHFLHFYPFNDLLISQNVTGIVLGTRNTKEFSEQRTHI